MMRHAHELYGKPIAALDGELGKVSDFYFDDRTWQVKYLVVVLGRWFNARQVLISPNAFSEYDGLVLKVQLTKNEITECPDSITDPPVSKQHRENSGMQYVMSRPYGAVGEDSSSMFVQTQSNVDNLEEQVLWDMHLRSCKVISRYRILCNDDGEKGAMDDVLIDDRFWFIRLLIVNASLKIPQHPRLLDTYWVDSIDWALETIMLSCSGRLLQQKPEFDPMRHSNISYEDFIHNYDDDKR